MLRRFASNAGANIFSGAVSTAYLLAITGVGARVWHGAEFSSWALALSVAAIAPIFAVNLSSVVTRRVVEARHDRAGATESAILQAGYRAGRHLTFTALATLIVAGALVQMNSQSKGLSTSAFVLLLTCMLVTNSWLLLWQARFGHYYADESNWLPALMLAGARLGGITGMVAGLAVGDQSLFPAAFGLCAGTWTGLAFAGSLLPKPRTSANDKTHPSRTEIQQQYRENLRLLSGFAVGAVSMLVIQYSIPPAMALIAPERFNAFYLANTLNTVAVNVLAAAMSAMLAPLTRWRMGGETSSLRKVALLSPVACATSCLALLCCCWYAMEPLLSAVQVRAASLDHIRSFLAILGFQTIIRNAAAGYAMYIASTGTSNQIAIPLLIEVSLAFTVAIPLGWAYGETALLYGLIVSSLIGSLYSSRVVASMNGPQKIALRTAFASLLFAQIAISGVWWLIARSHLMLGV